MGRIDRLVGIDDAIIAKKVSGVRTAGISGDITTRHLFLDQAESRA